MSKFIIKDKTFRRVDSERAKELIEKEGWRYSNKFDWQKAGSPTIEQDRKDGSNGKVY